VEKNVGRQQACLVIAERPDELDTAVAKRRRRRLASVKEPVNDAINGRKVTVNSFGYLALLAPLLCVLR
jgi:hypothetical protein